MIKRNYNNIDEYLSLLVLYFSIVLTDRMDIFGMNKCSTSQSSETKDYIINKRKYENPQPNTVTDTY